MNYYDRLGPLARAVVRESPYEVDLGQALSDLHRGWRECTPDGDWISPTDYQTADFLKRGIRERRWS